MANSDIKYSRYPGTLVLPGDSVDIDSLQILGRRVAGKEFSQGIVSNLNEMEELNILVFSEKEKEYLKSILNPFLKKNNKLTIHTGLTTLKLNEIENIHIPGPDIDRWSVIRTGYSSNKFSITGIIHSLCSHTIINGFKEYIFGGLESWDALVCTSSSGKEVVERTINYFHESFERKYNLSISKEKRPQLYQIPLAVNDITKDRSLTREQKRLKSRNKLGISKDAIVILFLGRLSFHGKAHPLPLYRAISHLSSQKDNQEIILLECGTFPNKEIENLYNNLIRTLSNLTVVRIGGVSKATEEAKIDSLNSANIFISLSDNIQETFGLTVIEAMAASLPCVVSDWNGYKDLVKDSETGYLIPTKYPSESDKIMDNVDQDYKIGKINYEYMIGIKSMKTVIDENALIQKLSLLIDNKEIRENMGYKSKERWNNLFTWRIISSKYRDLWRNLKEIREGAVNQKKAEQFYPSMDYMFKDYSSERYNEDKLIVKDGCYKPEILLFPLHSKLVDIITTKKTKEIIEYINKNKCINYKGLEEIGIDYKKQKAIMALIEKLGIAKKETKEG